MCLRKFGLIDIALEPRQRLGHASAMDALPPPVAFFCLLFSGCVNRQQQAVIDYLLEENRLLRTAQGTRRLRLTDDQRRRLAVKGHVLGRHCLAAIAGIVVRMATENPTWGYTRIHGGLKGVGHEVGRNTIKAILQDHGIEPAPERGAKMSWKTFLAAHWDGIAAADFFTVEVLTLRGFVRYAVFFVMTLKTRTVEIAGVTSEPDGAWMTQLARNLTDSSEGLPRGVQYIILDRDPLYTAALDGPTWRAKQESNPPPCTIAERGGSLADKSPSVY